MALLFNTPAWGQFQSGIFSSNYSGVMGVHINPAGTSWLSDGADFLPGAAGFEATNSNFYIPAKPIYQTINKQLFRVVSDTNSDNLITYLVNNYNLKKDIQPNGYAHINGAIYGPSLLINYRKRSFGIITSFKTYSSAINLPPILAQFLYNGAKLSGNIMDKPFSTSGLNLTSASFIDIGYTNSNIVADRAANQWRVGFNIRALVGVNAFFFNDLGSEYNVKNDSDFFIKNASFSYGFAAHNKSMGQTFITPRAGGAALDLGILYIRKDHPSPTRVKKKCPNVYGFYRDYQTYKWRFGASITDVGGLWFFNQSYYRRFDEVNYNYVFIDSLFMGGVFSFDRKVKNKLENDAGETGTYRSNFFLLMPTRLNVQFDAHVNGNWYAGFLLTQRLIIPGILGMRTANIATITLRYERQFFECAIPVSVINYKYPTAGAFVRLGFLFFGTNTLPEIIGARNIRNIDFYAGIKLNIGFVGSRFGMGF